MSFYIFVCAAPSPVSVVRKGITGKSSIALSWAEPDRPNGIILEYEIKYFEKVKKNLNCAFFFFLSLIRSYASHTDVGLPAAPEYLSEAHIIHMLRN